MIRRTLRCRGVIFYCCRDLRVIFSDPGFWEGLWNSLRPIANTSAEWLT